MKIAKIYSHLNGLEYLLVHNKKLWNEVKAVIKAIDAEACKTKISKEKGMEGDVLYSPPAMNESFKALLAEKNGRKAE